MRHGARCLVVLACCSPALPSGAEDPPGTFQLTPQIDLQLQPVQVVVPERFAGVPRDLTLNLPPGFSARVFAAGDLLQPGSDLIVPRHMAFSPEGVLHVANMGWFSRASKRSQIVAFPDRDGDGVADRGIVVADGFTKAHSLAFHDGALYVADTHQVVRLWDRDGDGIYEEREVFIDGIPTEGQHETRTIVFDERAGKIYLGVGLPCDLCRTSDPERAAILQFELDGSGRRVFASGIRNAVGMALHPVTGQLWATHNGHDFEGPHLPPEWIDVIRDGGFYGVPFAYSHQVYVNFALSEYQPVLPLSRADSLLVQRMRRPVALVPAHLAPMAIHFYTGDLFPSRYLNAAFIALKAGRLQGKLAAARGFKVVALFSQPDGADARVADFVTGFEHGTKESDLWGKPMGLATDRQGHLYISSDEVTHAILRIEYGPLGGSWRHDLPDAVSVGSALKIDVTVHVDRVLPGGGPVRLWADLSDLGGPPSVPLVAVGDSTFQLQTRLELEGVATGTHTLRVTLEQEAGGRLHTSGFEKAIAVLPLDLPILDDGLAAGWQMTGDLGAQAVPEAADAPVYSGARAAAVGSEPRNFYTNWVVEWRPASTQERLGLAGLHLAFHPGDTRWPAAACLALFVGDLSVDLLRPGPFRVDLERREWQVVEVPFEAFDIAREDGGLRYTVEDIAAIRLEGNLTGTFYIDDVRLVTAIPAAPPAPTATAVVEMGDDARPDRFVLEPGYPNPFNSGTTMRFDLSAAGDVHLAVYSLTGQEVAQLARGWRAAGVHAVRWDGRDASGQALATGVYICRLRGAGGREATGKLLLLR